MTGLHPRVQPATNSLNPVIASVKKILGLAIASTAVVAMSTEPATAPSVTSVGTAAGRDVPARPADTAMPFPLRRSDDGRYLVDHHHHPFLIKQMVAWALLIRLSEKEADAFFDAIKAKGFNAVMMGLIFKLEYVQNENPNWTAVQPSVPPFAVEGDFSTPNETYFAHADAVLRLARDKGILVMLVPAYLGVWPKGKSRSTEGWADELIGPSNSVAKSRAYGEFLGKRYHDFDNIIWVAGGDHNGLDGPTPGDNLVKPHHLAIIEGIREHDRHLWTGHWKPKPANLFAFDHPGYRKYMDLDGFYVTAEAKMADRGPQYKAELAEYVKYPRELIFQLDQAYEMDFQEPDTKNYQWIRRKNYDGLLSGCAGTCFTPGRDTMQKGGCLMQFNEGWQDLVGQPADPHSGTIGLRQARHCFDLFTPRAWQNLVPDTGSALVTAGRGMFGDIDYVCAAKTADGRLALAYMPTARTVTIAMAELAGPTRRAKWFNPIDGSLNVIGAFAAGSGAAAMDFTTPGVHPDGSSDWILLFED